MQLSTARRDDARPIISFDSGTARDTPDFDQLGSWKSDPMVKRYAHFEPELFRTAAHRLATVLPLSVEAPPEDVTQHIDVRLSVSSSTQVLRRRNADAHLSENPGGGCASVAGAVSRDTAKRHRSARKRRASRQSTSPASMWTSCQVNRCSRRPTSSSRAAAGRASPSRSIAHHRQRAEG